MSETIAAAPAAPAHADAVAPADNGGDAGVADNQASATAAAAEALRVKLKGLDGAEKEYTPAELEKIFERAQRVEQASHKKMEKSAAQLKSMTEFIERLRTDPYGALQLIGHDPDSLAERRIAARLEEMNTPEDVRRARQIERENEIMRRQLEEMKQAETGKQAQAAAEAAKSKYYEDFGAALTAAGLPVKAGDPADDEYFQAMARIVLGNREERRRAAQIGIEDHVPVITYEQAARQVIETAISRANRVLGAKKGDALGQATAEHLAATLKGSQLPKKPSDKLPAARLNDAMGKAASDGEERMDIHAFRRAVYKR